MMERSEGGGNRPLLTETHETEELVSVPLAQSLMCVDVDVVCFRREICDFEFRFIRLDLPEVVLESCFLLQVFHFLQSSTLAE